MAKHYGAIFERRHGDFVSKGVFDGYIGNEARLHADSLLLKNCATPEFFGAYEKLLNHFRKLIWAHAALRMAQDETWLNNFQEVVTFIITNHSNPLGHTPEERGLYFNWLKQNRKLLNTSKMKEESVALF